MRPPAVALTFVLAGCAGVAAQEAPPTRARGIPGATSASARQDGLASWYSDSLAGGPTASGRPYDPAALTAAHRTLPFGTRVRVTRADTGATVEVTVTDRGPFGDARRVIDLSRAAASALEMLHRGVAPVRLEVLELGAWRYQRNGHHHH